MVFRELDEKLEGDWESLRLRHSMSGSVRHNDDDPDDDLEGSANWIMTSLNTKSHQGSFKNHQTIRKPGGTWSGFSKEDPFDVTNKQARNKSSNLKLLSVVSQWKVFPGLKRCFKPTY